MGGKRKVNGGKPGKWGVIITHPNRNQTLDPGPDHWIQSEHYTIGSRRICQEYVYMVHLFPSLLSFLSPF